MFGAPWTVATEFSRVCQLVVAAAATVRYTTTLAGRTTGSENRTKAASRARASVRLS